MTTSLPPDVVGRLRTAYETFLASDAPDPLKLRQIAAERRVLPIVKAWGALGAIRLDGIPVELSYEALFEGSVVRGRALAIGILGFCAAKFPTLAALRPTRPAERLRLLPLWWYRTFRDRERWHLHMRWARVDGRDDRSVERASGRLMASAPLGLIRRLTLALVALVALAVITLTGLLLLQGGSHAVSEFGLASLRGTWPTLAALTVVLAGPPLLARLDGRPRFGLVALVVWIASAVVYRAAEDGTAFSLRASAAVAIWAGVPILVVYALRSALSRTPFRPLTQVAIVVIAALVLAWLTAPMALVVVCAVTGNCP